VAPDRREPLVLISKAVGKGARKHPACVARSTSLCTFEHWMTQGAASANYRSHGRTPRMREPTLGAGASRHVACVSEPRIASLPPHAIVSRFADEGRYLASESTFYRIVRVEQCEITQRPRRE
jgi:hypothetical protein